MAADGSTTPLSAPHPKPLSTRQRRHMLEAALDRLLGAVDGLLADLDVLDGDADFEPALGAPERHPAIYNAFDTLASTQADWAAGGDCEEREEVAEDEGAQCEGGGGDDACEDEGAQCEGEGDYDDREPDDWGWEAPDHGTAYPSAAGIWPPRITTTEAR